MNECVVCSSLEPAFVIDAQGKCPKCVHAEELHKERCAEQDAIDYLCLIHGKDR